MRAFWLTALRGLMVFAIIFDILILGAIFHGSDNSNSTTGQVQTYPDTSSGDADYIDLLPASAFVQIPLIQPN